MQDCHRRFPNTRRRALTAGLAMFLSFSIIDARSQTSQGSTPTTTELTKIIDAAKAEGGTLDIMNFSLAAPDFIAAVSKGMSRKYGSPIRLNVVPGPTPSELAPQLVQEYQAKRPASTDIFLGDDVNAMVQVEADSVVDVDWKALEPTLPDEAIGPHGSFLRLASRIIGCLWYNTNLVGPQDVPRTLKDVLNPKWKGLIASTSFVAGFREAAGLFGKKDEMVDFLKAFQASGNLAGFIRGGEAERIASGEFAMMAVAPGEYPVIQIRKDGAPIGFAVLQEMPYISFWVMSIPKNSAHPNLAKLLALYLSSREGQDEFYKLQFFDLHYLPGSKTAVEFNQTFQTIAPVFVTNDILTSGWKDYASVTPILTKSIRGSR